MILSMTGFGKSEKKNNNFTFNVEVKSLNNRFIEVVTKMPYYINQFDKEIIDISKKKCIRGKIIININIINNKGDSLILNKDKLKSLIILSEDIKRNSDIKSDLLLSDIINMPDLFNDKKIIHTSVNKRILLSTVKEALDDLIKFRLLEGKNILKDLNKKIKQIESTINKIKRTSITNTNKEFQVLTKKIKKISKNINNLDKDRLYQEIALTIEKKDINEEIIRFESHIDLLKRSLNSREHVGKKINFILQEMLREVNTIGSKTDKIIVSHSVVNIKNKLEQIKEQVQNIL
tara:strand:+ start:126 stop:998 length:873 start_codon:yes stop_codon:yes gene_type:complete